ncbi:protein of unknown function (DUF932) [Rhizobium leguminosarum bv. trifolii WSM597]|uniref:DUF945 domain-containing protein n=1 Tax=Rhizobium leguminosarum bv. trifolii WSM597 TaxID=754764 RepID=I9N4T7_RHILT|nr:DUF932 domain-containing protein [Rhizobium leguminosarum]EJB02904.1 protein of unknown function (DUF932) [Rhizobium leguminosarum bv. trifolii WSM597]
MNMIYAPNTARFDHTARAMTEDEMRRVAPSIFAVDAHESRSERFQPIPTIDVLRGLLREGFMPVGARQARTRDEGRKDFTKHMIRMRRLDDGKDYTVGDTVFEIILKNANDGTAAYDLMAGLFRIVCKNSLVSQTGTLDSLKVRHSGTPESVQSKVIEGTYEVLRNSEAALAAPSDWSRIQLDKDEKMIIAEAAHVLRFDDQDSNLAQAIDPSRFLTTKRVADRSNDLWTQFNVVQENIIRGGLHGTTRDDQGRRRNVSTRAVKGIDQDVKLNKALWLVASRMAELKGVKADA